MDKIDDSDQTRNVCMVRDYTRLTWYVSDGRLIWYVITRDLHETSLHKTCMSTDSMIPVYG